jgi:peptidoglycan/xylan/chitin deacetylase (PgdA/CDA1 family)
MAVERLKWSPKPIPGRLRLTTSWDDGHPLDLRVAELLAKHGLRGTFYVPRSAPNGTMHAAQIRELAVGFEIGAHTLDHVVLTQTSLDRVRGEITGSRNWLADIVGVPCNMFCPPEGKYWRRHAVMAREAGFLGLRSVELLSLAWPRREAGIMAMPTSVQAFPHDYRTLARNALKRAALRNLWRGLLLAERRSWPKLAATLLERAARYGGVFHLWGHSWELRQTGEWNRLEEVMRIMGSFASQATVLSNGEICQESLTLSSSVGCA